MYGQTHKPLPYCTPLNHPVLKDLLGTEGTTGNGQEGKPVPYSALLSHPVSRSFATKGVGSPIPPGMVKRVSCFLTVPTSITLYSSFQ